MSNNKETAKHALLKELDDVQSLLDDADSPTRPPLLKPSADTSAPDSQRIRQLASERANPFLSGHPEPGNPQTSPAPSVPTPAPQQGPAPRPTLTNSDIDAAVDELVAEALPKLEKALRLKLRAALRRKA